MHLTRIDPALAEPAGDAYFEGDVRRYTLVAPSSPEEPELLAVFFAPGARTRPHAHQYDQTLHVIAGRCLVRTDEARYEVGSGELITIPAGVWHWHGAAAGAPMCHVSIKRRGDDTWDEAGMASWPAWD
jgi:quercetin dioxygenase-like cupin family protein